MTPTSKTEPFFDKTEPSSEPLTPQTLATLADLIKTWGRELGFQQIGITDVDLGLHRQRLRDWLAKGYQGDLDYMSAHGDKRLYPDQLHPGTLRIISARIDYLAPEIQTLTLLDHPSKAYISRYALGRDYHKLIRKRLTQLGQRIEQAVGTHHGYRAFVDSAPVLERGLAQKAGLGWIGKNTMTINPKAGSYFFLGELFTNLPLPIDPPFERLHCGSCSACLDICPTQAFVSPHVLDARKCISYLTIENKGSIPREFRKAIGNRIFGCDDCQLVCPWNKFAKPTQEQDFKPRHQLDQAELCDLFLWGKDTFLANTEGSAIRRIGHERWLRNLAVGLGNADTNEQIINTLKQRLNHPSALVQEHVAWALEQHNAL
jgi:epoxyqueuosine reductase